MLVADDVLQHPREDALLLRRPAVKTVAERQYETCFASTEAPVVGGLPEERRQQVLTPAVQVSVHDRLCDPAGIVAQECRNAGWQSCAVVAGDLVQGLAGDPGTRVAGALFEDVQQRRECTEAPAKHRGGAEDSIVALTWLPRLQHWEQRWRDASHIGVSKALFKVIRAKPAALTAKRGERPRHIAPSDTRREVRGAGNMERTIHHILMEEGAAEALLVTEVVTPAGHWSSYPPHKHDTNDLPNETQLEETYYHRLRDARGFAVQRVYTADRSLDETVAVRDGDLVLVPRGYHTVSAAPGYELYYLNVMAGPVRRWCVTFDPEHERLRR